MGGGRYGGNKPLSRSQLQRVLRHPYYIGTVTYYGIQYEGRHEALTLILHGRCAGRARRGDVSGFVRVLWWVSRWRRV
ncbi:MAG: hypothetical protein M3Q30_09265 [Actinomycetota bacterium]|nr:hypothetical protein [Actinomycetota bacterium]